MSFLAFTIDVEEWFHILDTETAPARADWDRQVSRIERNTHVLLDELDRSGVRATCFCLGWAAEQYPGLVREIAARGHEIASHGHDHLLAFQVGRERFREDAQRAKAVLEDVSGAPVLGYRAAGFSITPETPWAFEDLVELGHVYDSSVFPARRGHGGFPGAPRRPYRWTTAAGPLLEFPIAPLRLAGLSLPFSGGGYLRLFPSWWMRLGARRLLAEDVPVNVYVHPREVDPDQPRLALSARRRFMTYVNVARGLERIRAVLGAYPPARFRRLCDVAGDLEHETGLVERAAGVRAAAQGA